MPRSTVISRSKQSASVFLDFMAHSCVGHANSQFSTLLFATVRFTARFKNMRIARENSQQNDRSNTITRSVFLSMNCMENWIKNCVVIATVYIFQAVKTSYEKPSSPSSAIYRPIPAPDSYKSMSRLLGRKRRRSRDKNLAF